MHTFESKSNTLNTIIDPDSMTCSVSTNVLGYRVKSYIDIIIKSENSIKRYRFSTDRGEIMESSPE